MVGSHSPDLPVGLPEDKLTLIHDRDVVRGACRTSVVQVVVVVVVDVVVVHVTTTSDVPNHNGMVTGTGSQHVVIDERTAENPVLVTD